MKISQPLVLLLGGLLSASTIGCSAISAVVSDYRPTSKGSAERMAAIGRVFENQGRYDQAEVMYRKALKQNPNNVAIREQLQQLADRRSSKTFEAESVASALAVADSVSPPATPRRRPTTARAEVAKSEPVVVQHVNQPLEQRVTEQIVTPTPLPAPAVEAAPVERTSSHGSWEAAGKSQVESAVAVSTTSPTVVSVSADTVVSSSQNLVTSEQILAVVDSPSEHAALLLTGLSYGESLEVQCLCATLMGECDSEDLRVRSALQQAGGLASSPHLRIAICDSQIQRGECSEATINSLVDLMKSAPADVQIQACSDAGLLSETAAANSCLAAIHALLDSDDGSVRAAAAVTLGEFPALDSQTMSRLQSMADSDSDVDVRDAAKTTLDRKQQTGVEQSQEMLDMPSGS